MSTFLEDFKRYLEETPREQIEADWRATEKFDSVGIPVDQFIEYNKMVSFKHQFRSIPYEEIMANRSSAYEFLDFNNTLVSKDNENNKAC